MERKGERDLSLATFSTTRINKQTGCEQIKDKIFNKRVLCSGVFSPFHWHSVSKNLNVPNYMVLQQPFLPCSTEMRDNYRSPQ